MQFGTVVDQLIMSILSRLQPKTTSNISAMRKNKVKIMSEGEMSKGCCLGLDTHRDISCAEKHICILEYVDGKSSSVHPFNPSYQPLENIEMNNGIVA